MLLISLYFEWVRTKEQTELMLDAKEGHLLLRLDRWLVQGQGVVAVW